MRKTNAMPSPNGEEIVWGWGYLLFQMAVLPEVLTWVNGLLPHRFSQAEINFTFYLINFLAVCVIFRRFLGNSASYTGHHLVDFFESVVLGVVAYYVCTFLVTKGIRLLDPGFRNANDAAINAMSKSNWYMMAVATVILVPPVEECFYRGLVFRSLYGKNHAVAYIVSIAVFAAIHILGFLKSYSPLGLVLCFFQYLPAGLCLAWSYARGGSICAPIVIHAIINARSIQLLR